MKTKIVKRHFCDFCGKGGFKAPRIQAHEDRCFKNPNRSKCFFCEEFGMNCQPLSELLAEYEARDLSALKTLAESCPACILATLLAYDRKFPPEPFEIETGSEDHRESRDFDYKKESMSFRAEYAAEHFTASMYS